MTVLPELQRIRLVPSQDQRGVVIDQCPHISAQCLRKGPWRDRFAHAIANVIIAIENGEISVSEDEEVGKAKSSNPRTAIGIIDELHYVFVVSDGRTNESEGLSLAQLAEVMQELGYPLLGTREVTKRSGKRFRHALYTFEDGTAIDVTYSDDGQIAMELGGLDNQDRVPDEQETIYLCDAMESFCTSFEQIEERLRRRGIVIKERIHMLPPTEENAQIINTEDYHLSVSPSMMDVKRHASGSGGKKQMHKVGE